MKDDGSQQEDVAGLFRKFGGDVAGYKEFAPAETPAAAPVSGGWALVNGGHPAAPEPAVAAPAAKSAEPAKAAPAAAKTTACSWLTRHLRNLEPSLRTSISV